MRIKLNQTFKAVNGDEIGSIKECYVLDSTKRELLKDKNGKLVIHKHIDKNTRLTLKTVLIDSLLYDNKEVPTQKEKAYKFKLYEKINKAKTSVNITDKEKSVLLSAINNAFTTLVAGQAFRYLENKD